MLRTFLLEPNSSRNLYAAPAIGHFVPWRPEKYVEEHQANRAGGAGRTRRYPNSPPQYLSEKSAPSEPFVVIDHHLRVTR
jgi:hypothetical protein